MRSVSIWTIELNQPRYLWIAGPDNRANNIERQLTVDEGKFLARHLTTTVTSFSSSTLEFAIN